MMKLVLKPRRIGRSFVLSGASLAVFATGAAWLVTLPDAPPSLGSAPTRPPSAAPRKPEAITPTPLPAPRAPAPAPAAAPRPQPAAVAPPPRLPTANETSPPAAAPSVAATPTVEQVMAEVLAERDLLARLRAIDLRMLSTDPNTIMGLLETLLDRSNEGDVTEVGAFRVGCITRLGVYKTSPRADRRLQTIALDAGAPRNERIAAIDALSRGGVAATARPALELISTKDSDDGLRERAKAALGKR